MTDDATIRRCIGFAKSLGFDELRMLNLFGWRNKDVTSLLKVSDPVGPDNDRHIAEATRSADLIVCAWGAKSGPLGRLVRARARSVAHLIAKPLHALRITPSGDPEHPLYLPSNLQPVPFEVPIV